MAIKWKKEVRNGAASAFMGIAAFAVTSVPVVGWGTAIGSYLYFANKGPFGKKGEVCERQAKAA